MKCGWWASLGAMAAWGAGCGGDAAGARDAADAVTAEVGETGEVGETVTSETAETAETEVAEVVESEAQRLRHGLGIPDGAARVLILGQNAHLDVDWQMTFDDYYTVVVQTIFEKALAAMAAEPAYRYAICEMAYLRQFWETDPGDGGAHHTGLLARAAEGRLHIVGGGVSSPDVMIPLGDNLLRDYRAGIGWATSVGLPRSTTAYLPDDFGLGPTTPDLLAGAGFDAVAFWRADGSSDTPNDGSKLADFAGMKVAADSNAELLSRAGNGDFIWEGPGGARIFTHWLAQSYLVGDYIDYAKIDFRVWGDHIGTRATPAQILDNMQTLIDLVGANAATDYLFAPVGGDFVYPKADLVSYARAWNEARYAATGVWVVAATFDDFAKLAMTQSEKLAVRQLDLTPYWMGFYATRPALKEAARLGSAALTQAETLGVLGQDAGFVLDAAKVEQLAWTAGKSNHHDWITGTSNAQVFESEQVPQTFGMRTEADLLVAAGTQALADHVSASGAAGAGGGPTIVVFNSESYARTEAVEVPWPVGAGVPNPPAPGPVRLTPEVGAAVIGTVFPTDDVAHPLHVRFVASAPPLGYASYRLGGEATAAPGGTIACTAGGATVACEEADAIALTVEGHTLTLDAGGRATSWREGADELFAGPSGGFDIYTDDGGLYTFGSENVPAACGFVADARSAVAASQIAIEDRGELGLRATFTLADPGLEGATRTWTLDGEGATLDAVLTPPAGTSVLAHFNVTMPTTSAWMAVPAGITERPAARLRTPTFWPFERWLAIGTATGPHLMVSAPSNPAVTLQGGDAGAGGAFDIVLARDARGGRCAGPLEPSGAPPEHLRLRLVGRAADAGHTSGLAPEVVAQADRAAALMFAPLRAAVQVGAGGSLPRTRSLASVAGPGRVYRLAQTANGLVIGLERRHAPYDAAERPGSLTLDISGLRALGWIAAGAEITVVDATETEVKRSLGTVPAAGDTIVVPLDGTYTTLRFGAP